MLFLMLVVTLFLVTLKRKLNKSTAMENFPMSSFTPDSDPGTADSVHHADDYTHLYPINRLRFNKQMLEWDFKGRIKHLL